MRPTHPNHTDSPSVETIARPAASTHRPRKRFPSLPAVPSKVAKPPQALDAACGGRRVAERTIGWLSQGRRMSKDYERSCQSSQAMIHAVMSRLMLRRLARA